MKRLENLSARIEEANQLTVQPVCGLKRAIETYETIKKGQSLISEEAVVDLNLDFMKEALEAVEQMREMLSQLYAEASVSELLGDITVGK